MLKMFKKYNFYDKEHDVQSHMFRPTITDMQDKYCGNCYDVTVFKANAKEATKEVARRSMRGLRSEIE